ncbi:VOC family protein [Candidatus Binatus sp.]|jgi:PhnB protein|uniref:VOC family protein n=1 Tax=Candidatus Binatus sp. TaxID=2811406 RepID=UPI003BDBAC40
MGATNKHIQPGYTTITPYLYARLDLADFLKNAFGAEVTHTPTPGAEGQFHAEAKVGDAHVLFGNGYFSDPSMAAAIYIYVPDVDATYQRAVSLAPRRSESQPI